MSSSDNGDEALCAVCFMPPEVEGSPMAACSMGHSLCADCTVSYLGSALTSITQAMLRQWKDSKTLPCPLVCGGGDAPLCCLTMGAVLSLRDASVAAAMCDLSSSLSSTIAQQDVMNRMVAAGDGDADGEDGEGADSANSEAQRLVGHITGRIDELCTMCIACPHCQAPFMDFSGCMALTCGACGNEFCGVCLSKTHYTMGATAGCKRFITDAHAQVLNCLQKYDPQFLAEHGMRQGDYFLRNEEEDGLNVNWERWKDRIKAAKLLTYLFTIKKDVLWRVYDAVEAHVVRNQLMNAPELEQLRHKVFSHEANAQHLVRIPVLFGLLYASKMDCSFGRAMEKGDQLMDQRSKIEVGRLCVERMREAYPSWKAVRVRVPGETFEAINYPPEALGLITTVIDEWGARRGLWKGVSTSIRSAVVAPPPPPLVVAPAPAAVDAVLAVAAPAQQAQERPPDARRNNGRGGARGRGRGRGAAPN